MLQGSINLTPLQRAVYTLICREAPPRKLRAAMRVVKEHTREEWEQALSVLASLGFIAEREDLWL